MIIYLLVHTYYLCLYFSKGSLISRVILPVLNSIVSEMDKFISN
jgi:hypothetical protein